MKSRGMTSKPASSGKEKNWVKMAPAQVSNGPKTFSDVMAKSPPKAQQLLPVKAKCKFCANGHLSKDCPTFLAAKTVYESCELARKKALCLRCMKREKHIAYNCPEAMPMCGVCKKAHRTCFHNYEEKKETESTSTSSLTSGSSSQQSSSSSGQNGNAAPLTGANGGEAAAL